MTRITLNGKPADVAEATVFELVSRIRPSGYAVVDGFGISRDVPITEGMSVCIFSKEEAPSEDVYEALISARHTPGVYRKMKGARIGIAGLGGLGSNITVMLARAGVGFLRLVDMDVVDATNINRQDYCRADIGREKSAAMCDRIASINPYIRTEAVTVKVTPGNASELFSDCDIVVEAFDNAENKAMLITAILSENPDKWVVSGNGMAGYGPSNSIRTTTPMRHLVMCGDMESEACIGNGLMAPRVMIAAAHQANAVMRIILGLEPA